VNPADPVLGREYLRYRVREKRLEPIRLDEGRAEHLRLATALLSIFARLRGHPRAEIEQAIEERAIEARSVKVARGMGRVLEDLSRFESVGADRAAAIRRQVFHDSAAAWIEGRWDRNQVLARSSRALGIEAESLESGLHADRRGVDRLEALPEVEPGEVLAVYNRALLRGLLVAADRILLDIDGEMVVAGKPKAGDLPALLDRLSGRPGATIRAEGKWGGRRRLVWEPSPAGF
jgi:predicted nuclease of restriction endonuclease-like RecB superfamily